jgi:hypothetical protein
MTLALDKNVELNIILATLQGNPLEIEKLIANPSINWKILYKLIHLHRVWHQVYAAFTPLENQHLIPIYKKLALHCQRDKSRILTTAAETLRVAREFTKHNLQHCFIKGVTLNESLYGGLITRPCKDIDVWVDAPSYRQAMDVLISLGYQKKLPTYELSGFKEQYYMQHKHDIAFYHVEHKVEVELHFRLSYFGINFFPLSSGLLKSTTIMNVPVQTLEDHYHLLYLMLHGAIHAFIRLRWLNDIALYIKKNGCSPTHIMALAKQIHCEHIVIQTLILIRDFLKLETLEMQTLLFNPSQRSTQLATICKKFIIDGYELNSGLGIYNKHFFNYRFYLVKLATTSQRVNAILGDLFKIDNMFPHVTFSDQLKCMYYILYPLWVVKYVVFRKW